MKLLQTRSIFLKLWPLRSPVNYLKLSTCGTYILPLSACKGLRLSDKSNLLMQNMLQSKIIKRSSDSYPSLTWDNLVTKDVTLFTNDDIQFHKNLLLFALSQCVFWMYLSYIAITTMKDDPVSEKEIQEAQESLSTKNPTFVPVIRHLNLGKHKNGLGIVCGTAGIAILVFSVLFTRRSIKSLALRKGGKKVTLEIFSIFGKGEHKTIPLDDLSAQNSRQNAKSYMALKLKGHPFYYLLDITKGKFLNEELFDRTAGLRRQLD